MARNSFNLEQTKIAKEINKLQKRAEMLQARKRKPALDSIMTSMREYSITPEEIAAAYAKSGNGKGGKPVKAMQSPVKQMKAAAIKGKKSKQSKQAVAVKYRDEETGNTWTGRGKPPRWLTDAEQAGKSRNDFLINGENSQTELASQSLVSAPQVKATEIEPLVESAKSVDIESPFQPKQVSPENVEVATE